MGVEKKNVVDFDTLREELDGYPGAADVVIRVGSSSVTMSHRCSNDEFTAQMLRSFAESLAHPGP
jgi:hypothetical protein